jgi:hypothetical protein
MTFSEAVAIYSEIPTKQIDSLEKFYPEDTGGGYPETPVNFHECGTIAQAGSLPPLQPGFGTRSDDMGFVVDKVALSRFSASYSAGPVFRSWSGDRLF